MREIISVAAMKCRGDGKRELEDPTKLSINELRAELYKWGGDIDGPRSEMISQFQSVLEMRKKIRRLSPGYISYQPSIDRFFPSHFDSDIMEAFGPFEIPPQWLEPEVEDSDSDDDDDEGR